MTTVYGRAWELVEAALPGGLGPSSPSELQEAIREAPHRVEEGLQALPSDELEVLRAELGQLLGDLERSATVATTLAASVSGQDVFERSADVSKPSDEAEVSISAEQSSRILTYLALGSLLLRRALTITHDRPTADAVDTAFRELDMDERVATRLYDLAASKGIVPAQ